MRRFALIGLLLTIGALSAVAQGPTWPGNATDFACEVKINGLIDSTPSRVLTVNALDIVGLRFHSPGGGTDNQLFSAFYQLIYIGVPLVSQVIPGETPPGGFWLDTSGTNPGVLTTVVPYLDGIGFGGPAFLAPVLLPGGSDFSFVVPPIIAGQAISLFLQAVIVEPGLNSLDLGIDDCVELQVI